MEIAREKRVKSGYRVVTNDNYRVNENDSILIEVFNSVVFRKIRSVCRLKNVFFQKPAWNQFYFVLPSIQAFVHEKG